MKSLIKTNLLFPPFKQRLEGLLMVAWYGNSDEELYFDTGSASTMTKATAAKVGWLHKSWSLRTKDALLEKVLKAKNNHVNLDKQGSIQGFDLSKYT